jgi:hypothetical protein
MGRSEHAARWLRARWQRAGWAQGRTLLVGRPVFVWLTRDGSRVAGAGYKPWEPNAGALAHLEAVNEVRLLVARRRPGAVWVCERELSARPFAGAPAVRAHRPDAVVQVDGGRRVAVEVELTLKSRADGANRRPAASASSTRCGISRHRRLSARLARSPSAWVVVCMSRRCRRPSSEGAGPRAI